MQNARTHARAGNLVRMAGAAAAIFSAALTLPAFAVTESVLHSFHGASDGATPNTALIQATDGNFYGVASTGGPNTCGNNSCGTIFKMTPTGVTTTLHAFNGTDGSNPSAALIQGTDGYLYGTAFSGGAHGSGTVFKISTTGTFTTLYSFATIPAAEYQNTDGANPDSALIQLPDGNFYGTTLQGALGGGTIFRITPAGALDTLHKFVYEEGELPAAGVIHGLDGNLYGATLFYGPNGGGTIYKFVASTGTLTTLHAFSNADGATPIGRLVQAADGSLYGTTREGGIGNHGTVFKLSAAGVLTTLHAFGDAPDGQSPFAGLVMLPGGNLYGTTQTGANSNGGTVFTISPAGKYAVLHSFTGPDGYSSKGGLLLAKDGNLYGPTEYGGAASIGTIYKLINVLPPSWVSPPTPADNTDFDLTITQPFSQQLQAKDPDSSDKAHITASSAPSGSIFSSSDANLSTATFSWTPANGQAGDYLVQFNASSVKTPALAAASRTLRLHVHKRGTTISASPTLLTTSPLQLTLRMRATLAATLPTQALAGKTVAFTSPNGQALCSGTTNASGTATCDAVLSVVQSTLSLGYVAKFTEDGTYLGSSTTASLIK